MQNQQQNHITITAKIGLPGAEESATLWLGREPKGGKGTRRDLQLSRPLPELNAADIESLCAAGHGSKIAALISTAFADYLRRVKAQRLEAGDSYTLMLPESVSDVPVFMLAALAEGTRERQLLSGSSIREVINSAAFKQCAAAYVEAAGIKADAFKRIVIDEVLKGCTRQDACIYQSRVVAHERAAQHLQAVADMLAELTGTEGTAQSVLVLQAAIKRVGELPVVADDAGI